MRNADNCEQLREPINAVLTGVGFGRSELPIEVQASRLEKFTYHSVVCQAAREEFEWVIACDANAPEECCTTVDRVAGNAGANVAWIMNGEQTWGDVLLGMFGWGGWSRAAITTVGCPAGGALNRRYLETVKIALGQASNVFLTFNGGVLLDGNGGAGYTKIKYNEFAVRREYAEAGWLVGTCYQCDNRSDMEDQIVLKQERDSRSAWAMPAKTRVPSKTKIDLGQFGL